MHHNRRAFGMTGTPTVFDLLTVAQDAKVAESQFMHQPLPVYEARSTAGQAVQEYEPRGKAMHEITRLYEWTCSYAS